MQRERLDADQRLSRYVIRTIHQGAAVLYDTVSRRVVPHDASDDALREAGMLRGQESQVLWQRLVTPRLQLALTLVVTWECNLRCTHCSVRDRLVRVDPHRLDGARLEHFARRYAEETPEVERLRVSLLGGEPLVRPDSCLELIAGARNAVPGTSFSITTNLAVELGDAELSVLREMEEIIVSIDGLEEAHNAQRLPYRAKFNPYQRTMTNLARLAEEGLNERLLVQGAIRDDFATGEHFQEFHRQLVRAGVPYDRIRFDTVHPAEKGLGVQESFLESLRYPLLRTEPCCKFRGGTSLVIGSDGTIFSDFYTWERLGTLDDSIASIRAAQRKITEESMPALEDPNCRNCPVIGYCWGGCVNGHQVVGTRPSQFCGQEALIERIRSLAAEGKLVGARESLGALPEARQRQTG